MRHARRTERRKATGRRDRLRRSSGAAIGRTRDRGTARTVRARSERTRRGEGAGGKHEQGGAQRSGKESRCGALGLMAKKKIDANMVADWFLSHVDRQSGDSITHLKLQKLVYYAQAWFLANFNKPIFNEDVQAWAHGPVVPSLWKRFKDSGWDALPPPTTHRILDGKIEEFLKAVLDEYGKFEAKFLEEMTHQELPWKKTRGNLPVHARCNATIPKEMMRDFYGKKIKKTWKGPILPS